MIGDIFFDVGNTLTFVNVLRVQRVLARHGVRLTQKELRAGEIGARAYVDDPMLIRCTKDRGRWYLYFSHTLTNCGVPQKDIHRILPDLHAVHEQKNIWDFIPMSTRSALAVLKRRGYRLSVISNANGSVYRLLRERKIVHHFSVIIDSHIVGVEKPNPRIFEIAMEAVGANPEASLYVGDSYYIDVIGAQSAGMQVVLLDPHDLHSNKSVNRIRTLAESVINVRT